MSQSCCKVNNKKQRFAMDIFLLIVLAKRCTCCKSCICCFPNSASGYRISSTISATSSGVLKSMPSSRSASLSESR